MDINESSNTRDELENNGNGIDESKDTGFDAIIVTPSHLQCSRNQFHQKNVRNKKAVVKQKSVSVKKVNQAKIVGPRLTL